MFVARAWNPSNEFEALDVDMEVRFRDRPTFTGRTERLPPAGGGSRPYLDGKFLEVDLGPPPGLAEEEVIEYLIVRFSDSRKICRYEWRREFHFERKQEGTFTSTSMWADTKQEQISGP
jgi:hypothetical protein